MVDMINSFLIELGTPVGISYFWNFGSMLAFCLGFQIVTGLFLAFHFSASVELSFYSVVHISRDVAYGWLVHFMHANGASLFFVCLYFHIGRGILMSGFSFIHVWMSGVMIFLLLMVVAFLGYVLPWGQMSFWGATVITNLLTAIPYFGSDLVCWLWGGYSVGNPTLVRFFAFHFLFPFVVVGVVIVHLVFLHEFGSSMPLGLDSNIMKVEFHPYFGISDLLGIGWLILLFMFVVFFFPNILGDSENFIMANSLVTPVHIQPEWYFLFAYAILRSIPNSLGGVVALVMAVLVLFMFCFFSADKSVESWSLMWKLGFWWLVVVFICLIWIGARAVEYPYINIGQVLTGGYFFFFFFFVVLGGFF